RCTFHAIDRWPQPSYRRGVSVCQGPSASAGQARLLPVAEDALLVAVDPGAVPRRDVDVRTGADHHLGAVIGEVADPAGDDVLVVDLWATRPAVGIRFHLLVPAPPWRQPRPDHHPLANGHEVGGTLSITEFVDVVRLLEPLHQNSHGGPPIGRVRAPGRPILGGCGSAQPVFS